MDLFIRLIMGTANALLTVMIIGMLLRAVCSWLPISEDNPFLNLLCMVTEPIIAPFRNLFERMNWFQNLPIDVSFLAAYLVLMVAETLLQVFG